MTAPPQYVRTAETLVDRILKLIPDHPEIMDLQSPWKLFKVPGFECSDLGPSLAQASAALAAAQSRYRASKGAS